MRFFISSFLSSFFFYSNVTIITNVPPAIRFYQAVKNHTVIYILYIYYIVECTEHKAALDFSVYEDKYHLLSTSLVLSHMLDMSLGGSIDEQSPR